MYKKTRRFLSLALALCLTLALLPTAALAADSDFTIENGTLTKYTGPGGDVTIPGNVTSIGWLAFARCDSMTSVTIPDSVTNILTEAFKDCTGLTSVTIPDSVTGIGGMAFHGCSNLTSVTLSNSSRSVGFSMFSYCTRLASVDIPDSVICIRAYAFLDCTGLTSVTIPSSVTSIEEGAFSHCTALKDVYYGGSEAQWKAIQIDSANDGLASAAIHYNSPMPERPETPDTPADPETPSTLPTVEKIPATGTAVARTQDVLLDGKTVSFQYYAVKDVNGNEANYVKVRDLAQALSGTKAQFNVGWDGKISISSNTPYLAVGGEGTSPYSGDQPYTAVSDTPVSFNGSDVNLTSFQLKDSEGNGYTYYKLRDLGQLLNFNVTWNGSSVVVESDKPYTG